MFKLIVSTGKHMYILHLYITVSTGRCSFQYTFCLDFGSPIISKQGKIVWRTAIYLRSNSCFPQGNTQYALGISNHIIGVWDIRCGGIWSLIMNLNSTQIFYKEERIPTDLVKLPVIWRGLYLLHIHDSAFLKSDRIIIGLLQYFYASMAYEWSWRQLCPDRSTSPCITIFQNLARSQCSWPHKPLPSCSNSASWGQHARLERLGLHLAGYVRAPPSLHASPLY